MTKLENRIMTSIAVVGGLTLIVSSIYRYGTIADFLMEYLK